MIKKTLCAFVLIGALISSCGTQKRITATAEKSKAARETVNTDSTALGNLQAEVSKKLSQQSVDSSINQKIDKLISSLQNDLGKIQETVNAVDFFLGDKKIFVPEIMTKM